MADEARRAPKPAGADISHKHRAVGAGDALDAASKLRLCCGAVGGPWLAAAARQGGHLLGGGVDLPDAGVARICHCEVAVRHLADGRRPVEQGWLASWPFRAVTVARRAIQPRHRLPRSCKQHYTPTPQRGRRRPPCWSGNRLGTHDYPCPAQCGPRCASTYPPHTLQAQSRCGSSRSGAAFTLATCAEGITVLSTARLTVVGPSRVIHSYVVKPASEQQQQQQDQSQSARRRAAGGATLQQRQQPNLPEPGTASTVSTVVLLDMGACLAATGRARATATSAAASRRAASLGMVVVPCYSSGDSTE